MNNKRSTKPGAWTSHLRQLLSAMMFLAFALGIQAQSLQVTGTVTDKSGEPLIGANVIEQGSQTGTITDFDGNYVLTVKDASKAVLTYSYVGYETVTENVNGRKVINVVLSESSEILEEVVVVGYGQQKKESVVGAISQINSSDLLETPAANLSQAITGKIPGVITSQTSGAPGADDASIFILSLIHI